MRRSIVVVTLPAMYSTMMDNYRKSGICQRIGAYACVMDKTDGYLSIGFNPHAFILYTLQKISCLVPDKVMFLLCGRQFQFQRVCMQIDQNVFLPRSS